MVRPAAFAYNAETAANNYFQQKPDKGIDLQVLALSEFDRMVGLLRSNGIQVIVIEDTATPKKPDAVFPNNWFNACDGRLNVFPMFASCAHS